jgi:preprotein translocase subunit SecE
LVGGSIPSRRASLKICPLLDEHMQRVSRYLSEVWAEMKKATWPWDPKEKGFARYKELTDATTVVFIAMVILAAFVGVFDFVLRMFFQAFTS